MNKILQINLEASSLTIWGFFLYKVMICLVEILERKNPGLRGRGWKKCRQTEEKAREVTVRLVKFYWK